MTATYYQSVGNKQLTDTALVVLTDERTDAAGLEYLGNTAGSAVQVAIEDVAEAQSNPSIDTTPRSWEYNYEIKLSNHNLDIDNLKKQLFEAAYAGDFRFSIVVNVLTTNDPLIVATMLRSTDVDTTGQPM